MTKKIVLFDAIDCPNRVKFWDARSRKIISFCSKFTGSDVYIICRDREFPKDCPLEDD